MICEMLFPLKAVKSLRSHCRCSKRCTLRTPIKRIVFSVHKRLLIGCVLAKKGAALVSHYLDNGDIKALSVAYSLPRYRRSQRWKKTKPYSTVTRAGSEIEKEGRHPDRFSNKQLYERIQELAEQGMNKNAISKEQWAA